MTTTTRRQLLSGTAAAAALSSAPARAQTPARKVDEISVPTDGKYAMVPLRSEVLRVAAVQSAVKAVDHVNPKPGLKANMERMLNGVDAANGFTGPKDLVCFHEFPLTGWSPWTREQALKVALEIPGEETEILGRKAKQHNCYIAFGTFAKDRDWPGHLLSLTVLIAPDGKVVGRHWKPYCLRDLRPNWDLYTTGIYEVLPRYVEMYGWDEVVPVTRTDIGNITLSSSPLAIDMARALAMKGAELFIRTASGGFPLEDNAAISLYNRVYTVIVNNSVSPGNPGFLEYSGAGNTTIYAPGGRVLAAAKSIVEELVEAPVPLGDHRKRHRIPEVPMEMLLPVFQKYVSRYAPGINLGYQPKDFADAARYYATQRRW
jgi:predicted amidohydrolase